MRATEYPYQYNHTVIFQDLDAMRHVNNVSYLVYFETARINYMYELFEFPDLATFPIILGDVYCRYESPAFYQDALTIGVGATRFGRKSFDLIYQIDNQDQRPIARGKTTMVTFDYAQQKTILIPQSIRDGFAKHQGDWHHNFVA